MCIRCRSPVELEITPLGQCTKNERTILQDYTLCDTTNVAELLIVDGTKKLLLFAVDDCTTEVAATANPTDKFLTAPQISEITYNQQNSEIVSCTTIITQNLQQSVNSSVIAANS